ncbi:MAG: hypothetical protein ACKVOQ_23015 [Cyclobacteriaceae bacterium]
MPTVTLVKVRPAARGALAPGYPLQAPSARQRAEFIPSAAEGGFPLLSLAEHLCQNHHLTHSV